MPKFKTILLPNGQRVKRDKKWSDLSLKQRGWIKKKMRELTYEFCVKYDKVPNKQGKIIIYKELINAIKQRQMWIPNKEIKSRFDTNVGVNDYLKLSAKA